MRLASTPPTTTKEDSSLFHLEAAEEEFIPVVDAEANPVGVDEAAREASPPEVTSRGGGAEDPSDDEDIS